MATTAVSEMGMEEQFAAAGNALSRPFSSLAEVMCLLDRNAELLSKVEQSPGKSMLTALLPLMDALIAENLLKHSDADVKVGVASCLSEITRITAPVPPYDDEKMREVFRLIVSVFEDLSNTTTRSYFKRITILETMAKVRYCIVMLDLEVDEMIIEMFKHFFRSARVQHPKVVVESMEAVMSLVIKESGDESSALPTPIFAILKRNNEEALPNAKKLSEKVIQNCAEKYRSYLTQISKNSDQKMKDGTDSTGWECKEGQSGIIDFPMVVEFMKDPLYNWVWEIENKLSYKNWEGLIEELINRYCGRKATNPFELISKLMKEEVSRGCAMAVLRLWEFFMDDNEGPKDELLRTRRTHGPTTFN